MGDEFVIESISSQSTGIYGFTGAQTVASVASGSVLTFTSMTMPSGTSGTYAANSTAIVSKLSQWWLAYAWNPLATGSFAPYLQNSYLWKHTQAAYGGPQTIDTDVNAGPFGFTDVDHPCGVGLAIIGTPTMNSQRRWSYAQAVTLTPGVQTVYIHGGSTDAGGFAFADGGTTYWANAVTRVDVSIQFTGASAVSNMQAATTAGTITFQSWALTNASPPNIAAQINWAAGSGSCTVTLIWHFELFVENVSDASWSGPIG